MDLLFTRRALGSAFPIPNLKCPAFNQILWYLMICTQIVPRNLNTEISIMLFQPEIPIRCQGGDVNCSPLTPRKPDSLKDRKKLRTICYGYHLSKQIQSCVFLDHATQGSLHKHSHSAETNSDF